MGISLLECAVIQYAAFGGGAAVRFLRRLDARDRRLDGKSVNFVLCGTYITE
ncbi:hypothetical protein D3C85_1944090 [compost metagenome]